MTRGLPPPERLAALVLAGGAGRRLGGADKPLLDLGGRTLLAWVIARLRDEPVGAIALSANGDPARFARFGLAVLDDGAFAGAGPLAGLLAGLDWAAGLGAEALLTVPGDTPFVPAGLTRALAPPPACAASGGAGAAPVGHSPGGHVPGGHSPGGHVPGGHEPAAHYLVALWPVAAREALRARLIGGGSRKVGAFAAALGMREVAFAGVPAEAFLNVNTAADLAAARLAVTRAAVTRAAVTRAAVTRAGGPAAGG